jgi:hypothetical protein
VFEVGSLFDALCRLHDKRDARGLRYVVVTVLVYVVLAKLAEEDHLRAEMLADLLSLEKAQAPLRCSSRSHGADPLLTCLALQQPCGICPSWGDKETELRYNDSRIPAKCRRPGP